MAILHQMGKVDVEKPDVLITDDQGVSTSDVHSENAQSLHERDLYFKKDNEDR